MTAVATGSGGEKQVTQRLVVRLLSVMGSLGGLAAVVGAGTKWVS
jgi:hypothetical protein